MKKRARWGGGAVFKGLGNGMGEACDEDVTGRVKGKGRSGESGEIRM